MCFVPQFNEATGNRGSRTSETEGDQIFADSKFFGRMTFLGIFRKNVCISQKNFIYLPKF